MFYNFKHLNTKSGMLILKANNGTRSGTRTHTPKKITDFKSVASANSAIRAHQNDCI